MTRGRVEGQRDRVGRPARTGTLAAGRFRGLC
jgi:hypothetical protein